MLTTHAHVHKPTNTYAQKQEIWDQRETVSFLNKFEMKVESWSLSCQKNDKSAESGTREKKATFK